MGEINAALESTHIAEKEKEEDSSDHTKEEGDALANMKEGEDAPNMKEVKEDGSPDIKEAKDEETAP